MPAGTDIYNLIRLLWPINRSITGNGNRQTLKILKKINKKLRIFEVKSNKNVYDWRIPLEWNVKKAFIKVQETGEEVLNFKNNNLHLMSYSTPINKILTFNELKKKLNL